MCAINPKFKKFYRLEFYTSHGDQETFEELLAERLIWMENAFNASGAIRAHVHENNLLEMFLCETERLILKPDQLYIFRVHPDCPRCKQLARI